MSTFIEKKNPVSSYHSCKYRWSLHCVEDETKENFNYATRIMFYKHLCKRRPSPDISRLEVGA